MAAGIPVQGARAACQVLRFPSQRPVPVKAGAFVFPLKEVTIMFEGQPQAEIEALIKADPESKQLYQRHRELDKKVTDAELASCPSTTTCWAR